MKRRVIALATCFLFVLLSACSGGNAQGAGDNNMDYQETKKMMIDLLKTDDGKKAIQDIMKNEDMKKQLLMNQDFIKQTIQQTLASKQGKQYLQSMLKDPKFEKALAQTMMKDNQKVLKNLMRDPEYQAMMMDILKNPEMQKQYLELMKSKPYRQQMQKVITETFQSPLFKSKMASMLQQVVNEELKKGSSGGSQKGGGQSQSQAS
jgi:spore germination protein D